MNVCTDLTGTQTWILTQKVYQNCECEGDMLANKKNKADLTHACMHTQLRVPYSTVVTVK